MILDRAAIPTSVIYAHSIELVAPRLEISLGNKLKPRPNHRPPQDILQMLCKFISRTQVLHILLCVVIYFLEGTMQICFDIAIPITPRNHPTKMFQRQSFAWRKQRLS